VQTSFLLTPFLSPICGLTVCPYLIICPLLGHPSPSPPQHQFTSPTHTYSPVHHFTNNPHHPTAQSYHSISIMASTHAYHGYPQSYPIQMPQKPGFYYPPQHSYGRVSASPPEAPDSVTTSGVPSYEPSASSSNYAGSASDYESTSGAASVDLLSYMGNRMNGSFDPMPLDRSLAKQAQT